MLRGCSSYCSCSFPSLCKCTLLIHFRGFIEQLGLGMTPTLTNVWAWHHFHCASLKSQDPCLSRSAPSHYITTMADLSFGAIRERELSCTTLTGWRGKSLDIEPGGMVSSNWSSDVGKPLIDFERGFSKTATSFCMAAPSHSSSQWQAIMATRWNLEYLLIIWSKWHSCSKIAVQTECHLAINYELTEYSNRAQSSETLCITIQ